MIKNLLRFFLHRNKDKEVVKRKIESIEFVNHELDEDDAYSLEVLTAMQTVIRMKEAADKQGAGFVAGFVTPSGKRFLVSNVDENHHGAQYVKHMLQKQENRIKKSNNTGD